MRVKQSRKLKEGSRLVFTLFDDDIDKALSFITPEYWKGNYMDNLWYNGEKNGKVKTIDKKGYKVQEKEIVKVYTTNQHVLDYYLIKPLPSKRKPYKEGLLMFTIPFFHSRENELIIDKLIY